MTTDPAPIRPCTLADIGFVVNRLLPVDSLLRGDTRPTRAVVIAGLARSLVRQPSYPEIAREIGIASHTSAMNAADRWAAMPDSFRLMWRTAVACNLPLNVEMP